MNPDQMKQELYRIKWLKNHSKEIDGFDEAVKDNIWRLKAPVFVIFTERYARAKSYRKRKQERLIASGSSYSEYRAKLNTIAKRVLHNLLGHYKTP